jgi:hypothetical protein
MDRLRSRLQQGNVMGTLKGMAKFRGMKMTDQLMKKTLMKSGDVTLRKAAYAPSATKHQAIKLVRKFAEHVKTNKNLEFTYEAKRANLDESDIAARRLVEKAINQQVESGKPKGPSKEDIDKEKRRERAKTMLHKYERAKEMREIDKKEHPEKYEGKPTTIAEVMKAKQQKAAEGSSGASARPVNTSLPQISGTTIHTVQTGPSDPDDALQVATATTEENVGQPQEPADQSAPDPNEPSEADSNEPPKELENKGAKTPEKKEDDGVVEMDIG